eukprot:3408482-Pleurochrysis_carterae.AAC.1
MVRARAWHRRPRPPAALFRSSVFCRLGKELYEKEQNDYSTDDDAADAPAAAASQAADHEAVFLHQQQLVYQIRHWYILRLGSSTLPMINVPDTSRLEWSAGRLRSSASPPFTSFFLHLHVSHLFSHASSLDHSTLCCLVP